MSDLTRNIHGDEMEVWLISRAATETSTRGRRQFADWVERDVARRDTRLQAIAEAWQRFQQATYPDSTGEWNEFCREMDAALEGDNDEPV